MIRAVVIAQRVGTNIMTKVFRSFSKQQQQKIAMFQQAKIHTSMLANSTHLMQNLTDEKLMQLVDCHHFLQDIVGLSSMITKSHFESKSLLSDSKATFLAYVYNLYHDRIEPQILLYLIICQLNQKINSNKFQFNSQLIQRHYLQQLHYLTYRNLPTFQLQKEFTLLYFKFIQRKFKVDAITISPDIGDQALQSLWRVMPYLPQQTKNSIVFLDSFEKIVFRVLTYQFQRLLWNQNQPSQGKQPNMDRLFKIRQICIRLSNSRQKMLNIFDYIPYKFSQQRQFHSFMLALKQFVTSQLAAAATKREMNSFHQKLSQHNKHYQNNKSYRSLQSYCESLIFLNVYRPGDFVQYFDPQGASYINLDKKYWNTKRWDNDKKN